MIKHVNSKNLDEFRRLLETTSRKHLIEYFDTYIYNKELEALKKTVYLLKENTKDTGTKMKYHNLYNRIKNKEIDYNTANKVFLQI